MAVTTITISQNTFHKYLNAILLIAYSRTTVFTRPAALRLQNAKKIEDQKKSTIKMNITVYYECMYYIKRNACKHYY